MSPVKTRRQRYSCIENIFRMLINTTTPILKTNLRNKLSLDGESFEKYLILLIDRELITYVDYSVIKERPYHKSDLALLLITDRGRAALKFWKQLMSMLFEDGINGYI